MTNAVQNYVEIARSGRLAALASLKAKRAMDNVVQFDREALIAARLQKEDVATPVFASRRSEFQEEFPFIKAA